MESLVFERESLINKGGAQNRSIFSLLHQLVTYSRPTCNLYFLTLSLWQGNKFGCRTSYSFHFKRFPITFHAANLMFPLYVIFMPCTRFRVNLHSIVSWMSMKSLLETSTVSDILLSLFFPFWTSRCFLPWWSNSRSNRGISSNDLFIGYQGCVCHVGVGILICSILIGLSD